MYLVIKVLPVPPAPINPTIYLAELKGEAIKSIMPSIAFCWSLVNLYLLSLLFIRSPILN